eukprot:4030619-Pyramimonas_sp.AAC.1
MFQHTYFPKLMIQLGSLVLQSSVFRTSPPVRILRENIPPVSERAQHVSVCNHAVPRERSRAAAATNLHPYLFAVQKAAYCVRHLGEGIPQWHKKQGHVEQRGCATGSRVTFRLEEADSGLVGVTLAGFCHAEAGAPGPCDIRSSPLLADGAEVGRPLLPLEGLCGSQGGGLARPAGEQGLASSELYVSTNLRVVPRHDALPSKQTMAVGRRFGALEVHTPAHTHQHNKTQCVVSVVKACLCGCCRKLFSIWSSSKISTHHTALNND